jgi:hypothetical protein
MAGLTAWDHAAGEMKSSKARNFAASRALNG